MKRRGDLDVLRAVAALSVFAFHSQTNAGIGLPVLNAFGTMGVTAFFVLSGYLLYEPFVRSEVEVGQYLLRRAARIVPAYVLALVAMPLVTGDQRSWTDPLLYLSFAQNFQPATFLTAVPAAWTLCIEVAFYVTLPLLAPLVRGRPERLLALAAISLSASVGAWLVLRGTDEKTVMWALALFPLTIWRFVPGMLVAEGWRPRRPMMLGLSLLALAVVADAGSAGYIEHGAILPGVLTAFGVAALVSRPCVPAWGPLAVFGVALSYPFYVWHADVLRAVIARGATGWLAVLIAAGLTVSIAACSYLLAERPILRLAHARLHRMVLARML